MTQLENLRLFATHPHPCSYLDGQSAKTLFIDPEANISVSQHSRLSELGFRRSGSHYYRPFCESCQACIPCRVQVDEFILSRRFRRVQKQSPDLHIIEVDKIDQQEHYALYSRYINTRHQDGDMYPATVDQYQSFLVSSCTSTRYFEMRVANNLVGVFVSDQLEDGMSAVYTYFDPDESRRSPGTLAILWQIEEARRLSLPHLYLGYWIKDCEKMNYKSHYRPLELLLRGQWKKLT